MYKIRNFIFIAALAFCLNGQQAYGMEDQTYGELAYDEFRGSGPSTAVQKLSIIGGDLQRNDEFLVSMTNLTELEMIHGSITGRTLKTHPHLTKLSLANCKDFQEDSLSLLSNLTNFSTSGGNNITGCTLAHLPYLTTLKISCEDSGFNEEFLRDLTQLTELDVGNNGAITGRTSPYLTNLRKLSLQTDAYRMIFEGQYLKQLTTLEDLNLKSNRTIQDEDIQPLTCLTFLNLHGNQVITDKGLLGLTSITELDLFQTQHITGKGLAGLPHLLSLNLGSNKKVTDEELGQCTNLTALSLNGNDVITINALYKLPKLCSAIINGSTITPQQYTKWWLYRGQGQIQFLLMTYNAERS